MATLTTLDARCYDCDWYIKVYGYSDGADEDWQEQWILVTPNDQTGIDQTGIDHLTHDVYIIGPA